MRPSALRRLVVVALGTAACRADGAGAATARDAALRDAALRDAALRELFVAREHSGRLVMWAEPGAPGPVLAELRPPEGGGPAVAALPPAIGGVPVVAVRRATLDSLFRAHPDGWKAFYARWPAAAGLVETSPARVAGDSASLVVGRSCGEHCRQAWRVRLRGHGDAWRVTGIEFLRVPRT